MWLFLAAGGADDLARSHTGAELGKVSGPTMWRQWLSPSRFLVAGTIILLAVLLLLPTILRVRQPAREAQCLLQLESVGAAISMYAQDHEAYPLPTNWHLAIRPYIGNPREPEERVEPGSARDPLKCKADPSSYPVSYLYLDRRILDYTMARLGDSVTPLAVDEYFHRYATMVWYDGHVSKMPKDQWAYQRLKQWKIRRNLTDAPSFSYERIPGTQAEPVFTRPYVAPTEKYIWPRF